MGCCVTLTAIKPPLNTRPMTELRESRKDAVRSFALSDDTLTTRGEATMGREGSPVTLTVTLNPSLRRQNALSCKFLCVQGPQLPYVLPKGGLGGAQDESSVLESSQPSGAGAVQLAELS